MKLAEFEVQTAVYSRIGTALNANVYDDVPEDYTYPYVELGDVITNSSDGKCNNLIVTMTLHGYFLAEHHATPTRNCVKRKSRRCRRGGGLSQGNKLFWH